jgi:hypothetical protein
MNTPTAKADPRVPLLTRNLLDKGFTAREIADVTGASVRSVHRWAEGLPGMRIYAGPLERLAAA